LYESIFKIFLIIKTDLRIGCFSLTCIANITKFQRRKEKGIDKGGQRGLSPEAALVHQDTIAHRNARMSIYLYLYTQDCYNGDVAQMVERSLSMREVRGSIPRISILAYICLYIFLTIV
jgi:hypothetical protein